MPNTNIPMKESESLGLIDFLKNIGICYAITIITFAVFCIYSDIICPFRKRLFRRLY
jgi:hypothetical protein